MEETLKVLNDLVSRKIIDDYAIGGAMGAMFYVEPVSTFDLDIFIALPSAESGLITLGPLYEALVSLGYSPKGECVDIEGVPVQFLPAYNDLVMDALMEAQVKTYRNTLTKVFRAEHLIAIAVQTGRLKDKQRVRQFNDESCFDPVILRKLLEKYSLLKRWEEWKR
jgi:hypothetical protein